MIQFLLLKFINLISIVLFFINFNLFNTEFRVASVVAQHDKKVVSSEKIDEYITAEEEIKETYNKGMELFNSGNYKKAIEMFEIVARGIEEAGPDLKKEYGSVKDYIAKAEEKLGNLIANHLNKAKQSKKLSEIIRELKSALNIDPELTEAKKLLKDTEAKITEEVSKLYFKGVDQYAADKLYEAIKIWKEALELKPDHARIKKDLARAESKLQLLNK